MKYNKVTEGVFSARPNRFIAKVFINGREEVCHIKNTGRLKELLVPEARKTKYDLICVEKDGQFINIDSQAPNRLFSEWATDHIQGLSVLRPEVTYKDSRFDFYAEAEGRRSFIEVKGVTLLDGTRALFPDAPTERGIKHIEGLIAAQKEGYHTQIVFVVKSERADVFSPNRKTHPAFAEALENAQKNGVSIRAFSCRVLPDEVKIIKEISVQI